MKITKYVTYTSKPGIDLRFTVVSDLHARPYDGILKALRNASPDAILLPGDILEIISPKMEKRNQNGWEFLKAAAKIAPCYYCYGNHELYNTASKRTTSAVDDIDRQRTVRSLGIHLVNDSFERLDSYQHAPVYVGGLVCGRDMVDSKQYDRSLNRDFLSAYEAESGYKILLCHYPHYYEEHLKNTEFDLILSGHAHGGQWRFFGKGVYAPHQGLFPKYTSGIHDGRHIISRGAVNNAKPIPRLFNPCEILEITVKSK
ncbi:MAG: metallophosphoesterase [Clostridia bacterium]|nr:metallophosphoesterase [Clostridia bacterium]